MILMVFERHVMDGCCSGVMFGWKGIICIIGVMVRCGVSILLVVVWVRLLVYCLCEWHELLACLDECGGVKLLGMGGSDNVRLLGMGGSGGDVVGFSMILGFVGRMMQLFVEICINKFVETNL